YPTTRSMGVKLCKLTPTRGMCAEISTAFVIMVAGQYKLPTSSSHCITGAIMGVGLVEGWHGVNWKFFTRQFLSWVLTPLATMAPTALIFAQ
ncbi:phosphate transporter, partial [Haematococcus lacustris]